MIPTSTPTGGETGALVNDPRETNPRTREDVQTQDSHIGFRGHDVVDPSHRLIGTISDVVYASSGDRQWAVVDLELLRSSHYVPIEAGHMSEAGEFVVPYDKQVVKSAPKADRNHLVDWSLKSELTQHYEPR